MTWLDPIGAALALLSTYLFIKVRRSAWGVGIIAVSLNMVLYSMKGLYGQLGLEVAYFLFMIYGWYLWTYHPEGQQALQIRHARWQEVTACVIFALLLTLTLGTGLAHWTDSTVPWWDASVVALGLVAQWLLCKKIIECWLFWFVVDISVLFLHLLKGIPFHAGLHGLYIFMATAGYWRWRRLLGATSSLTNKAALA